MRVKRERAEKIITEFLADKLGADDVPFNLAEDGEDGWAFWITDGDVTAYLHPDEHVEWYGTAWRDKKQWREKQTSLLKARIKEG